MSGMMLNHAAGMSSGERSNLVGSAIDASWCRDGRKWHGAEALEDIC
jgi:hypothetical protein